MHHRVGLIGLACTALLVACDDSPQDDAGPRKVTECIEEDVAPFPEGEPVWAQQDLDACANACPDGDHACRQARCPNSDAHDACLLDSFEACVTASQATCREQWEMFSCCSESCDDGQSTDAALRSCIQRECRTELRMYADCTDEALRAEDPCLHEAELLCLLP